MANEAASGTSRRAFLGRAAGAAAAVAGAGVGAGALAQSAAAADQRTYTAGRFILELDGVSCGRVVGVDGGDLEGDVVYDVPVGIDNVQRKHIGGVKYEDFTLQVGSGMSTAMYNWMKDSFDKGFAARKNGAIISGDFNWNEKSRQPLSNAFISSVTIPALDGTVDIAPPAYVAVKVKPPIRQAPTKPDASPAPMPPERTAKGWLPGNFVFEIDGVDTSRVATIDSFTWKCTVAADGSFVLDVSDIGVTFPSARLSSWQRWLDSLLGGSDDERDGRLTLVGANNGAVITVGLSNLGLHRLYPQPGYASRVKAEMYVEKATWDIKKQNAA